MRQHGFTLIELMLVIAVIGILAALILATVVITRSRAQNARLQSDLKQLRVLAETYSNQAGSYSGWGACVADPEPTGFTCASDAGLASSIATLLTDIRVRQPEKVVTTEDGDHFCMSTPLLNGKVACTDSTGQLKSDLPEHSVCSTTSPTLCP